MARIVPTTQSGEFGARDIITPSAPTDQLPVVRTIEIADIRDVLSKGVDDFRAMPTHVIFLSLIYPIAGLLLGRAAFGMDLIPILYPLATGFALVGPFAAIGLYELSRRRELGLDTSWRHAFDVVHSPSFPRPASTPTRRRNCRRASSSC